MTSALLDEDRILSLLSCKPVVDNASRLQAAAMMAVADAHDRKCTREEFVVLLDTAMTLHADAGKFFMMNSVATHFHAGALDFEMVTGAMLNITEKVTLHQLALTRFMERLIQCPETEDRVH
jgi:hypothetical protein